MGREERDYVTLISLQFKSGKKKKNERNYNLVKKANLSMLPTLPTLLDTHSRIEIVCLSHQQILLFT